ncbi:MAG: hypothetical protein ACOY4O_17145 [Pseudomonadota bacterium]|jgi:hypothetical protein
MARKDIPDKDSPKKDESPKPASKPAKTDKRKPQNDDDLYDQGDIATPRRDPPYEDGI